MARRPAPTSALLVTLTLVVAACSDGDPGPTPTARDTHAEIRAAREVVAGPAVALHEAVGRLVAVVAAQRSSSEEDPAARLAALDDVPEAPFEDLEDAIATVDAADLDGDTAPVRRAEEALAAATDAAGDVLAAARADLAAQQHAAATHSALLGMTGRWEEPGSRSQQLHRLAELAADADALRQQLGEAADVAPCLTTFERRAAAARHVADATRELRGHVAAYRGEDFDRLREELAEDPFALERPLEHTDLAEVACWRNEAPVVVAAAAVDDALTGLEAALNPSGPSPTATP